MVIRGRLTFIVATVTLTAFAVFWLYAKIGGGRTSFGFNARMLLLAPVIFGLFTLPLLGLIAGSALLLTVRRRSEPGACLSCGYGQAMSWPVCPECGRNPRGDESVLTGRHRAALAVALATWLGGIMIGSATGETWLLLDEAAFRREVASLQTNKGTPTPHSRARWWPGRYNGLVFQPGRGHWGTD